MIDAFHRGFSDPYGRPPRTYYPVPTGNVEMEIVGAKRRKVPWLVTDDNPSGTALTIQLKASSTNEFVYSDVPDDRPWMLHRVAQAVGIPVTDCVPEVLIGCRVRVRIGHVATKRRAIRAVVREWLPLVDALARRQPHRGQSPTLNDAIGEWARPTAAKLPPGFQYRNSGPARGGNIQ